MKLSSSPRSEAKKILEPAALRACDGSPRAIDSHSREAVVKLHEHLLDLETPLGNLIQHIVLLPLDVHSSATTRDGKGVSSPAQPVRPFSDKQVCFDGLVVIWVPSQGSRSAVPHKDRTSEGRMRPRRYRHVGIDGFVAVCVLAEIGRLVPAEESYPLNALQSWTAGEIRQESTGFAGEPDND